MPFSVSSRLLPHLLIALLMLVATLISPPTQAEPLRPEKAFPVSARAIDAHTVEVVFNTAPDYYLYETQFQFSTTPDSVQLKKPKFPAGVIKNDDFFGRVTTHHGRLSILLPFKMDTPLDQFKLGIRSQGCWEGGVCYPPQNNAIEIRLKDLPATAAPNDGRSGTFDQYLEQTLSSANLPLKLALFFAAGLLLAFTPCMYPMFPILLGIVVGAGEGTVKDISRRRAFFLSFAYVQGMAVVYATIGVVAGLVSGTLPSATFQKPWVLLTYALLFVVLALSMFGLFEIRLPSALQTRLAALTGKKYGGHFLGVALMGAISALIMSPCVTAPLALAVGYITTTGNGVLGALLLYTLALGMGVPLIILALAADRLLPRSGGWMAWVKRLGGVLMLIVAVWVAWPLFNRAPPSPFTPINSVAELDARLANTDRPVMLDFYADWCASCKEMARDTFSHPSVAGPMRKMLLLQADVTANTDNHQALLKRFGLVGPPGIVFFDAKGQQRDDIRPVIGFMPAKKFAPVLERVLADKSKPRAANPEPEHQNLLIVPLKRGNGS